MASALPVSLTGVMSVPSAVCPGPCDVSCVCPGECSCDTDVGTVCDGVPHSSMPCSALVPLPPSANSSLGSMLSFVCIPHRAS